MPDVVGYRDQLMDWIYDQAGGNSTNIVEIKPFTESIGLDNDESYTLFYYVRDQGLIDDRATGMGNPCAMLTSYGIADVLARRKRRGDPAQRARACRAGLLRWFYQQRADEVHLPMTEEFGADDGAVWEGARFSVTEIRDAAEYLAAKGLIKGATVAEIRGPVRAEITTDGIDCVTDWKGDMAEFLRGQRAGGPSITNHGPYIAGDANGANMAWENTGGVTQNHSTGDQIAPGFEPLAEAVAEILKQLPAYGLSPDDQQDAEDAANEVLAEVTQPEPEPRRVRRAVAALRGFLAPIVVTAGRAEVQELAQHGIDKLNHAIGM
jgi:hypothetical protein